MNLRNQYRGQTILVTGGAGAIGSNLSRALADAGAARSSSMIFQHLIPGISQIYRMSFL